MMRAVLVAVTLGAVAVVGIHGLEPSRPPGAPEPSSESEVPRACRFEVGQRLGFAISSRVRARLPDGDGPPESPEDRFSARLAAQVLEARDGAWRLRGALSRVALEQRMTRPEERVEEPLTGSFEWTIDARCRWSDLALPRGWSVRGRQLVATLVTGFELVLPERPGPTRWTVQQRDGLGRFVAQYEVEDDSTLVRRKSRYASVEVLPNLELRVQVLGGATRGRLAEDGAWLSSVDVSEQVRLQAAGSLDVVLESVQTLRRDDAVFEPVPEPDALAEGSVFDEAVPAPPPPEVEPEQARWEAVAARLAAWRSMDDDHRLAEDLAARIRARPELARELLEALQRNEMPDGARGPVFLALELSGTEVAWTVLSEAVHDPVLPPLDQARAASALSDHGEPSVRTADALAEAVRNTRSDMVRSVAQLALGNLGRRGAEDAETSARVRAHLASAVNGARTREDRVIVLDALGNAGDPTFLPAIEPHLDDDSVMLRIHAAEALRNLPPETAQPLLQARLEVESDARARRALVATLGQHGPPAPDLLPSLGARLAEEPSPEVRAELVRWLGEQPAARSLLAEHFRREKHAGVMRLIGRYVPAEALW